MSAVTTTHGGWSVSDPSPPGGTCSYRVRYAGSSTTTAAEATTSATLALRATDLTLTVARGTGSTKKKR